MQTTSAQFKHAAPEQTYYRSEHHRTSVCSAPLSECAACRERLAEIFAEKLGYEAPEALDIPVLQSPHAAYASLTELETSLDVRRLIVRQCLLQQPDFDGFEPGVTFDDIFVADDLPATPLSATPPLSLTPQSPSRGLRRFFMPWRA